MERNIFIKIQTCTKSCTAKYERKICSKIQLSRDCSYITVQITGNFHQCLSTEGFECCVMYTSPGYECSGGRAGAGYGVCAKSEKRAKCDKCAKCAKCVLLCESVQLW